MHIVTFCPSHPRIQALRILECSMATVDLKLLPMLPTIFTEPLSTDHKPMDEKERERIEAAGGFVEFNRVNGNLALSRALGDFVFKMNEKPSQSEQIVTCLPDILHEIIEPDWDF